MKAQGTTDMAAGLQAGIDEVAKGLDGQQISRVILLGDGVPNDEAPIRAMAESAAKRGISIAALGLGPDYNESLMGEIAQVTGGRFHYVSDSSKVAAFFKEEILRVQKAYARNAELELRPGPGVVIESVVGFPVSADANGSVRVKIGDVSAGERRELIVKLDARSHRDGAGVELMDAVLHFTETTHGTAAVQRLFVGALASADAAKLEAGRDAEVESAAKRFEAAARTIEEIKRVREEDTKGRGAPAVHAPAPAALPSRIDAAFLQRHDEAMRVLQSEAAR